VGEKVVVLYRENELWFVNGEKKSARGRKGKRFCFVNEEKNGRKSYGL